MSGAEADRHAFPSSEAVGADFLRSIPRDFAREHGVLSQGRQDGVEVVAAAEGTPDAVLWNLGARLGVEVRRVEAAGEDVARLVDEVYGRDLGGRQASGAFDEVEGEEVEKLLVAVDRDLLSTQGKGPVVQFVDTMFLEALGMGASDVHVQPVAERVMVRFRVDGSLHTVREIPSRVAQAVVSRIKVMGELDIAERRVAQDGRASVTLGQRAVDLRISTYPTRYGERAVVRLLDPSQQLCALDAIGMPADTREEFLRCARLNHGIVLVTGPTGSGKTTTLYSTLREIASDDRNVMTIEDPIEYELSSMGLAVSQSQVNQKKGVSFATGLRHILRQDPDVILVGEIRDKETARMAIQSALTGHLVFSTLHTNDAPSAVTRLVDLGVEPYLVSASVTAVLAQRLVRVKHSGCGGEGCEDCFGSGFKGRTGIFELIVIDEPLREAIGRGADEGALRKLARTRGLRRLSQEGRRLVEEGLTTDLEVSRVVQGAS